MVGVSATLSKKLVLFFSMTKYNTSQKNNTYIVKVDNGTHRILALYPILIFSTTEELKFTHHARLPIITWKEREYKDKKNKSE